MHMAAKVVTFSLTCGTAIAAFYIGVKSGMKYAIAQENIRKDHGAAIMAEVRQHLTPVYQESGLHAWMKHPNKNLDGHAPADILFHGPVEAHHRVLQEARRVSEGMKD